MNGHRSNVSAKSSTFLYEHFNLPGHSFLDASIQVIDYVDPDMSNNVKNDLLLLEDYWIEKLGTAFPLGLNDKKKGTGNISQDRKVNYFSGQIARYKRGRGSRKKTGKARKSTDTITSDINRFKNCSYSPDHSLYKTLKSYSIQDLDTLYSLSQSNSGLIYNVCSSFCSTFSTKLQEKNPSKLSKREFIVIPFICKFIDNLSLKSIFSDTSIIDLLPKLIKAFTPLQIFYKYNDPISLPVCNYASFLKNLTISDIKSILESPCECHTSPYIYSPHGHIVTGNLDIVDNAELRQILSYGCKYRVPTSKSKEEIYLSIAEAINNFIKSKSKKYSQKENAFDVWKEKVLSIISNRIAFYEKNSPEHFNSKENILEKEDVKRSLKYLKSKYIICSIDKASSNFSFICKKFYIQTLVAEMGFDTNTLDCIGNDTYKPCREGEDFYVNQISETLKEKFNITVEESNLRLARIFWNPKLHKNPYKARFIAGARFCVTKQLNILVNSCLKLLRSQFKKYCDAILNNSGINMFWSIDSSNDFLDAINKTDVYNIQVYDFTTLYTRLDLFEVENMINEVIDLIFSDRNKYICISKRDPNLCFFSNKTYDSHANFNQEDLKEAVRVIIYNTYVVFGGIVFIQTKGIPMGGNSSSPLADLTVGKKEFNYMKKLLQEKKMGLAKLLSNNKRYVDDLATINYLYFHNIIKDIYPQSLEMERAGNNNKIINYLDLNINISDKGLEISVYNKTDDFNFHVVSLTFPHGNIPLEIGYNVFFSQILRYGIICTSLDLLTPHIHRIFTILVNRGYNRLILIKNLRRCFKKYNSVFRKFGIYDDSTIINNLP